MDDLDATAELLRALAHPLRLQILYAVRTAQLSVGEIEEASGIGQPGLSQQLAVLRKAELVESQRTGKQVFYRVANERMRVLSAFLREMAGGDEIAGSTHERLAANPAETTRGGAAGFARVLR